eukprot:CAMPEP_0202892850 /NCGR_PEP_ID=MMETSP1392-20130828/2526_1 /ASSEMBLY_ACC=CAM_ASM_000868 /TAXON_ID=225041 /ORGANISM="Chlamydomonas chlamydogama, Strain SAG 11-48b" /LENGTH=234 /DNA_ID=CAMNT_0049576957 /DNA_START=131 /DNA_END=836 /DNA_ORIENTATION=-
MGLMSQGQMPPPDLLKLLISKLLGYAIMAGACITKLPQIQVVLKNKSAEGLSALSFELEALCLIIHTGYGYIKGLPFNTYGEAAILCIQSLILLFLVYKYARLSTARAALSTSIFAGLIGVIASGKVPVEVAQRAFELNTFLFMAARVPQIIKNFASCSTGQLSIITYFINLVGSIVRIFTTIQEGGGPAMLRQYLISLGLNGTIVLQILLFGNKGSVEGRAPKGQKAKSKKSQ